MCVSLCVLCLCESVYVLACMCVCVCVCACVTVELLRNYKSSSLRTNLYNEAHLLSIIYLFNFDCWKYSFLVGI